tara:strand:+ start:759 stop:1130 length:372 start_codon:yes stop_codon:yes gene_type:complete
MNNREQLGLEIAKLQGALDVSQTQMSELQKDLNVAHAKMNDYDKPKLTESQYSSLHDAIENAVDGFNFNEPEAYQIEYGIDYDGKVYADSIEADFTHTLVDDIIKEVEKLFGVADEDEDKSSE